jgi:hypothetical protein
MGDRCVTLWCCVTKEEAAIWLNRPNKSGHPLVSMFLMRRGRGKLLEYVRPGAIYRRMNAGQVEETVTVTAMGVDSFGIPHARFKVSFRRPDGKQFDGGERMLALKAFGGQYRERFFDERAAA